MSYLILLWLYRIFIVSTIIILFYKGFMKTYSRKDTHIDKQAKVMEEKIYGFLKNKTKTNRFLRLLFSIIFKKQIEERVKTLCIKKAHALELKVK